MIADSGWCFALPSPLLRPVNSSSKLVDRYRDIPSTLAFLTAAVAAFVLAVVSGIPGAFAAMNLYDLGRSRGDDFAVGLGGFYAAGNFTFIVVFTWLQKMHHEGFYLRKILKTIICRWWQATRWPY